MSRCQELIGHDQGIDSVISFLKKELSNKNLKDLSEDMLNCLYEKDGIANRIAKDLKMKRTQLRRYFSQLKLIKIKLKGRRPEESIPNEIRIELSKLQYLLAYSTSKKEAGEPLFDKKLYDLISFLLKKINTVKDYEIFESFFEAIIAYHAYHQGG